MLKCNSFRNIILLSLMIILTMAVGCTDKLDNQIKKASTSLINDIEVKRYPYKQEVISTNEAYKEYKSTELNYKLEGTRKDCFMFYKDKYSTDKLLLPKGTIREAMYTWTVWSKGLKVQKGKPIELALELKEVISTIEENPVYKLASTSVVASGYGIELVFDNGKHLYLDLDAVGNRVIVRGEYPELTLSVKDDTGYYCITAPKLAIRIKELSGWKPYNISTIKDIEKLVFIDKGQAYEVKDKNKIVPIIKGLRNAKLSSGGSCSYDRYIQLHQEDGQVLKLIMAGDDCKGANIEGTFFNLDEPTAELVHQLAHDIDLDWWYWQFESKH